MKCWWRTAASSILNVQVAWVTYLYIDSFEEGKFSFHKIPLYLCKKKKKSHSLLYSQISNVNIGEKICLLGIDPEAQAAVSAQLYPLSY